MLSCVLILPASLRGKGNALGAAMGWGPDNYSVPLTDGAGVTHYGLHAWASPNFRDLIDAGAMPEGLDFPQADFDAVLGALVSSFREDMDGHFSEVCAEQGLNPVTEEAL
ncbi:MAG: hypothetical protein ABFE07_08275 [Armatimonadia bacterium]